MCMYVFCKGVGIDVCMCGVCSKLHCIFVTGLMCYLVCFYNEFSVCVCVCVFVHIV